MDIQPADELLERFGVRLVAPLGGRLNQHWLVESGARRLVLRLWAGQRDSLHYEIRLLAQIAALGWPMAPVLQGPVEEGGRIWSLSEHLPGEPVVDRYSLTEQRNRGRLLAEFR